MTPGPIVIKLLESENVLRCKDWPCDSTEALNLFHNNCENYLRHFKIIVYRYHKFANIF